MAKGVYKHEIAVGVLSPLSLWYPMMHMQLFVIEERAFCPKSGVGAIAWIGVGGFA